MINTIVNHKDPDFLWHSNNALRNEVKKIKNKSKKITKNHALEIINLEKKLQLMEMKWNNAYWDKR